MSDRAANRLERERRRGRAEGLRMAASLLREGELNRADVLDALARDEMRADTDEEAERVAGRDKR